MKKIMIVFFLIMILLSTGCTKKGRESLEKYSDILTVSDLRKAISYPGIIEKEVVKNPNGVHISFYAEVNTHEKREAGEIFIAHIEYLISSEKKLVNDMKTSKPITGISDRAWYDTFEKGNAELFFYIADKNILVGLEGRAEGSGYTPSTFIQKEGFILLAKLIEKRLKSNQTIK